MSTPAAAPEPTERERRVATVVLALILLHAVVGYFDLVKGLPAWKMFAIAERFEYRVTDAQGKPFRVRDHLSRDLYVVNHQLVPWIGAWVAEREPERAPLAGVVEHRTRGTVRVWRFRAPGPGGERFVWEQVEDR